MRRTGVDRGESESRVFGEVALKKLEEAILLGEDFSRDIIREGEAVTVRAENERYYHFFGNGPDAMMNGEGERTEALSGVEFGVNHFLSNRGPAWLGRSLY